MDGARHHAVGVAHVNHHRAEVGNVANLITGLLNGHALLCAQACKLFGVALRVCGIVDGNDAGCRNIQAKLRCACADRLSIAEQYQVGNSALKNDCGCTQDAIVFGFGQDDALAVGAGAFDEVCLERKGSDNLRCLKRRGRFQSLCAERQLQNGQFRLNVRGHGRGKSNCGQAGCVLACAALKNFNLALNELGRCAFGVKSGDHARIR